MAGGGGPGWVRTNDLPVKSWLLCQLSYRPSKLGYFGKLFLLPEPFDLVDLRIRFLPNLFEAQAN